MKTPDEVRQDLEAARESFKTRYGLSMEYGWTSSASLSDWDIQRAAPDDSMWRQLVDEYVEFYDKYFYNQPPRYSK